MKEKPEYIKNIHENFRAETSTWINAPHQNSQKLSRSYLLNTCRQIRYSSHHRRTWNITSFHITKESSFIILNKVHTWLYIQQWGYTAKRNSAVDRLSLSNSNTAILSEYIVYSDSKWRVFILENFQTNSYWKVGFYVNWKERVLSWMVIQPLSCRLLSLRNLK